MDQRVTARSGTRTHRFAKCLAMPTPSSWRRPARRSQWPLATSGRTGSLRVRTRWQDRRCPHTTRRPHLL